MIVNREENRHSWGWLGDHIPENRTGWTDKKLKRRVIARLREIMAVTEEFECFGKQRKSKKHCVIHHCGSHTCEICTNRRARELAYKLGWNGSILIVHQDLEFRCPWAVVHYIDRHDYRPSGAVIEALFHGYVRTYDEVDGESWRQHDKEMNEEAAKKRELRAEIERNKTPEQKMRDQEDREYLEWCAKKVKQLRKSGAMVK